MIKVSALLSILLSTNSFAYLTPVGGGGGGGAVSSVNGQVGAVTLTKADVDLASADDTSDADKPVSTAHQTALDLKLNIAFTKNLQPNGESGGENVITENLSIDPLSNTPDKTYLFHQENYEFDPNSTGFQMGTNGGAANIRETRIHNAGTGSMGNVQFNRIVVDLGNGTDPITSSGYQVAEVLGTIKSGVTISNNVRGWTWSQTVDSGATVNSDFSPFMDAANYNTPMSTVRSFGANPNVKEIKNNNNYIGYDLNARVKKLTGNANYFGLNVSSIIGEDGVGNGSISSVYLNPTVTNNANYNGVYSSTQNVANRTGAASSVVVQDLTITFNVPNDNNSYTIEYVDDVTAGSETAGILGQAITVHIESGVSTATQVKAALDANIGFVTNATAVITGVGSNAQTTQVATNFTGGISPGTKWAGYFDGNVNITGSLAFGGALSIGSLTAFGMQTVADGGGNPASVNQLISSVDIPASSTTNNADIIGANTAMLVTVGANSTTNLGAFGLFAALGLPAVIETHTGSYLSQIQGALFALSFAGSSTGGTIGTATAGEFVAIPNGITTVDRYYGVWSNQKFGNVGTKNWSAYLQDGLVYVEDGLIIGSADELTLPHFGIESEKTVASQNGFQMETSGSQPTCDADHRGLMWNIEGGAGVADLFQVCQKTILDTYVWATH